MAFFKQCILAMFFAFFASISHATPFTQQVPGTNLTIPDDYPEAGGVVVVLIGVNGNSYFQFSNPTNAFVGFNSNGTPTQFRGNPFTINDPIQLDCGFSSCTSYFGGGLAEVHIRFTAFDGDTQQGGFDEDDIDLLLNGFNVGNWSDIPTQNTNLDGTQLISAGVGFGDRTFDTGWFNSTNPALLSNILTTNQTGSQVLDDDPNDNFWDFRRGNVLTNPAIVTVAPGYSLEKTADKTDFTVVGEVIEYEYLITNIGSVPIRQLAVSDDRIPNVTCDVTTINDTNFGGTPETALCTGTYTVTQEDVDFGSVTNIASATGVPDFGTLGELTDTVTVDGPTRNAVLSLDKSTTLSEFGAVNTTVPYSFVAMNDGNVTLENVTVTDPLIPSLSCTVASLLPGDTLTCSGDYTVQQSDIDNFASAGTLLSNTATATATALVGPVIPATDTVAIPGSSPTLAMDFTKSATTANYDAVGEVIQYEFTITNTGTVSFPDAPVISDPLTGGATCPSGSVAPNASITCLANYTVDQDDIDNGSVDNSATATIAVGSLTANGADTASVPAVRTTSMTLDKRLNANSPTSFNAPGVDLTYDYVLTNTGNVTLNAPLITDDRTTATCTDTSIAPGAQITCTSAAYTTIQADINRLGVTNIASATATAAGPTPATVTSNTDEVTVPAVLEPEITLVKTAPPVSAADFQVGNVITYTYAVTNTGNVRIRNIIGVSEIRVDDSRFPSSFLCFEAPLNVNGTQSCTADYVLTIDDINAGVVQNTATASAQGSALVGLIESAEVQVTIAPVLTPALSLVKTADVATVSETTDTITYTFSVTNSGDTQIVSPIQINDAKLLAPADCSAQPSPFNVGASFDCTGTYNPTQAELDAGQVDNAATASFEFTQNGATATIASDQDEVSVDVVQNPLYTFEKTASPTTFSSVGETITYTFAVENTGNVTFTEISVTDPLIPNLSCTFSDVAPDATPSCTGTYIVTQDDLDAEVIDNEATAAGSTAAGAGLTLLSDVSVPVAPGVATMIASIDKTADKATFAAVGEVIEYTLAVTNDGTQTLTDLLVTDSLDTTFSCEVARLLPTETSSICTFSHTVTQDDFDAGQVDNTATVASPDITTANSQLVSVTGPVRTSSFTLEKTASNDFTQAGDIVNFTFAVSNTGNTTLTNVVVVDNDVTPALNCTIPSLLPGVTDSTSCKVAYSATQNDVDVGQFTNTADATASAPTGVAAPAAQSSTAVVDGPTENASVQIVKSSTDGVYTSATDSEVFTFEVTNTGNVTLTGLSVSDANLGGLICPIDDLLPGAVATTCSDGSPLTATKNFTQFDIDAASFTNTASVAGQSAVLGTAVSDDDTVTVTGPVQAPALTMVKTETLGTTFDTLGQSVPYTFTVTNAGNTTLTGPITVVDDQIASVTCAATPAAGIAPGGTLECTGTHTVVQADLNLGSITNNATASVTQSVVAQNPGDPTIVTVSSPEVTEMIMAAQSPELMIDKRVKAGSPTSFSAINAANFITYEYVVTNIGNVTLLEDIVIVDDKFTSANLTCSTTDLAPLGTVTCEQTWFADQQALDDGFVTNVATADTTFVDKDGTTVAVQSLSDTVTVTAVQNPSLALIKTLEEPIPTVFDDTETLSYKFVVTNNGNVTIDGPITISDSLLLTPAVCASPADLEPTDTVECTATYDITSGDLELGSATNVATAVGVFDGDPVTSPSSTAIFPVDADPALSIVKSLEPSSATTFSALNDPLTYQYVVTNSGGAGFTGDISVVDDKAGTFICRPASLGTFNVGATHTCTLPYSVTQDDLDAGFVTNEASASTIFAPASGSPQTVVSPSDTVTVTGTETPLLAITKSVTSGPAIADVGDTLEYTIVATNTGNQTISAVAITDPLIPTFTSCTVNGSPADSNVILSPTAPNNTLTCVGSYTVTQADIDAQDAVDTTEQGLPNTATVAGSDPQGVAVDASATNTHPLIAPLAAVSVSKDLEVFPGPDDDFSSVGQEITFNISVTNSGDVTLTNTVVTDSLTVVPQTCTIGSLAPGETDTSCVVVYTVTQADFDAAFGTDGTIGRAGVLNTATATSQPATPNSVEVTGQDDEFAAGPERIKEFTLGKSSTTDEITSVGQIVTYTYVVANSGNVSLTAQPVVEDDRITDAAGTPVPFNCGTLPAGGLLPTEIVTCTQPYTVTQADLDSGSVTNIASVTSSEVTTPATATLTIDAAQNPLLSIIKTPSPTADVEVGDDVTYTYTVTNAGNVTIENVTVTDQHTSSAGTAALTVAGDTLITDVNETGTSTDAAANGVWDTLGSGDVVTFTATYTVTQDDVDQQVTLTNVASVTGVDPNAQSLPAQTANASVTVVSKAPSFTVSKTGSAALSDPVVLGDVVSFEITVANTGNQTLTGLAPTDTLTTNNTASDALTVTPLILDRGDTDLDGELDVGETHVYKTTYVVEQVGLDAGSITNTVSVTRTDPQGVPITEVLPTPVVINFPRNPVVGLVKTSSVDLGTDNILNAGDVITYTYTVSNDGNVTLLNAGVTETTFSGSDPAPTPAYKSGGSLIDTGAVFDIAVGAAPIIFEATYEVTQADLDAGEITNQATATVEDPDGVEISDLSDDDSATEDEPTVTTLAPTPGLEVVKTAVATLSDPVVVGDTIDFTITVANTGNVTLSAIDFVDTLTDANGEDLDLTTGPTLSAGDLDDDSELDVGETWTYLASFTLDQQAIDAGGVSNTATATGTLPQGGTTSDVSNADAPDGDTPTDVTIPRNPVVSLLKSAVLNDGGDGIADAGDTITYTFTVSNDGNVTLFDAVVSDTNFTGTNGAPALTRVSGGTEINTGTVLDIAVDAAPIVYTAVYTLSQDDVDAGGVTNQASVSINDPDGIALTDLSDPADVTGDEATVVTFAPVPGLEVVKTGTPNFSDPVAVGDTIAFTITVANTGNVTLSDIDLSDNLTDAEGEDLVLTVLPTLDSGDLDNDNELDVGETWTYLASFTLDQQAIDAGGVSNTATATGTLPQGGTISDVSNADAPDGDTPTDVTIPRAPAIAVVKAATVNAGSDGVVNAGDVVSYTYAVTNEGNVTLFDVGVTETTFTGSDPAPTPTLLIGGSNEGGDASILDLPVGTGTLVFTATYNLTQADIDAGGVDNQATASADDPAGNVISDLSDDDSVTGDDPTSIVIDPIASMDVVKTVNTAGLSNPVEAGDTLVYTITVENTGNVTLDNVVPTDTFTRRDGTPLALTLSGPAGDTGLTADALDATETWSFTATYTLLQEDVDAGGVNNTVTVTAESPTDVIVTDTSDNGDDTDGNTVDDPTEVRFEAVPELDLVKRLKSSEPLTYQTLNEEVEFEFEVTNTGNVTITAQVVIDDPLITQAGGLISCEPSPIAVGDSVLCSGSYFVTQPDLDNGSFENLATVTVNQPVVPFVDGGATSVDVESDEAEITVPATQLPRITIAKAVKAGSPLTYSQPGDTTIFEYTITNVGNVTLTSSVSVFDDQIPGTLDCGGAGLAPLRMVTCEQTWTADLQDLNDGFVTNTGTAQTTFNNQVVSEEEPATATVTAIQDPSLAIVKTLTSAVPDLFDVGTVLSYSFLITNDGNVTIDGTFTVDDNLSTVNCTGAPTSLDPLETATCTSTYTIRSVDLDLGSTVNVATALGSFDGVVVTSPSDDEIYPVGAVPALSLTKDSVPTDVTFAELGDSIVYTYTITNTGGVGFNTDIMIADNRFEDPIACYVDTPTDTLSIGETQTCTAVYEVSQDDLDAGFVTNEATASTTFAPGTVNETLVLSPAQTKTVPAVENPELTVLKSVTAGPSPALVDDILTYTLTAENTGNQTISGVTLVDPLIPALTCTVAGAPAGTNVVLLPDDVLTCVGTYTVLQSDVDAQSLINTATATGSDPQGETITTTGTNSHPLDIPEPLLVVTKAVQGAPVSGAVFSAKDETVTFIITVENQGNVTLNDLNISDNLAVTPTTCSVVTLAPGASDSSCIVSYVTTQEDVDALNTVGGVTVGGFTNIATATALPATPNATTLTETGDVFVQGPDRAPAFSILKAANVSNVVAFGDVISYTYTVTNSGNVTLVDQPVVIDDRIANVNCAPIPLTGLAPLETLTCSADYTVTQADIDSGDVTNIASVSSAEVPLPTVPGDAETSLTVPVIQTPGVSLVKEVVGDPDVAEGDTITYLYTVENTGNVTLTDVTVGDQHTSASGTAALNVGADTLLSDLLEQNNSTDSGADGVWDTLGPNDVVTFEATYVVTQDDIDVQNDLSNTATVTTTAPDGVVAPSDTQTVDLPVAAAEPELTAVKTADLTALSSPPIAGEIVTFEITVENTGNQTLDTVTLVDTLRRADGVPLTLTTQPVLTGGDAGVAGDLEVDEIWVFEATYALTQDDVDGGGITNSVLARAQSPNDTPVTDLSDNGVDGDGVDNPTLVQIPAVPGIIGVKTITSTTIALGETVTFAITAENIGNVTLRNVAVASDTLTRADGTVLALTSNPIFISSTENSGAGVLLPDEIATYTATYVLTQDDIDEGGISNSAVVTGTPPFGSPVNDVTDDNDPADGNETADLVVPSAPQLSLVKRLPLGASPTFSSVGEIIAYEFEVTNEGNVTLDGPFSIIDPLITDAGGEITCAAGPIAPDASIICTGEYAVVQDDIDLGSRLNTATATDGTTTSPEASLTVPALQLPAMEVVKVAQSVPAATFIPGLEVTYTYTVTNVGNTTFENPITINDNLIDAANITCPEYPVEGVAPTQTYVCTGIYTVSVDDVDLGSVTNLATATDGVTTSALVSETIPDEGTPALDIEKTAEPDASFAEVGDEIVYTFRVTNAGTRAFVRDVVVMDDRLGTIACFEPTPEVSAFVSGSFVTCSATDTVTQADLDAGFVTNEAFAQTIFGLDDTPTSSAPVSETVDAVLAPQITLAKSSTPNPVSVVGETLTYTLVATNEGNQTLTNVSVLDPLLPNLSCTIPELLRGETLTCEDTYIVTQEDIDRGVLVNTATVSALTPQGTGVSGTGSETTVMPASAPSMTLAKVASPSPFGEVDSTLTYLFTVTNTGNTTLSDITVTDVMDPEFACTISSLAPQSSDTTCSYSTIVTQEQVDAGEIINAAAAVGSDPFDSDVEAEIEITTPGPEQVPGLDITKVVLPSASALGSTVTFQLTVVNTGNVSLTPQVPVDNMERLDGTVVTLDAPFALISGDTDNDGLIDVTETWIYTASRVLVQGDLNAGGLRNSASLTATAPNGVSTTDVSDNGVDSDGNAEDDPTVFLIVQEPQLTVTKSVAATGTTVGDTVTFTIEALNSGNVDVDNLSITDTLRRFDGSEVTGVTVTPVDVPTVLNPGGTASWQVIHVVTQEDVDAGGLSNTATVSGTDPSGGGLSDVSADDDLADGNVDDDPTELLFPPAPSLEVTKTVASVGTAVGEDVVFNIIVTNTGNVTLTDVEIVDTMTNLDGDGVAPVTIEFIEANGAPASDAGTLQAGETATYTATYTLELADVDSGGLENTATATAMTLLGATVSDVSNNEAEAGDTPTIALIDAAPSLEVVKTASDVAVLFPTVEQITFTIKVTNTGNVTQTGLQVVDDLTIYSSPASLLLAEYPTRVTVTDFVDGVANTAYDGVNNINTLAGNPTLAPGETGTVVIVSTYSSAAAFPADDNTATATSDQLPDGETGTSVLSLVDADGDGVVDSLEGNGDRDGDGISDSEDFDPTGYFYCESDGRILSGGAISVSGNGFTQTGVGTTGPITIVQDGNSGFFQFFSTAAGTFTMSLTYPPVGVPSTTRIDLGTLDATSLLPANPASIGSNEFGSTGVLADFTAAANPFYTVFDIEAGDPFILNNNIPVTNCVTAPNVLATKTADRTTAVIGETVNYTLSFVNNTSQTLNNATFVDQLPAGMLFTPGSSSVDGVLTAPVVNGRRLEFGGLTIAPAQTISVTLSARVVAGAAFGALTNQAWLEDSTGTRQSNIATATVQLQPEPVFDCSDVIGKVYDDINRNAYQDEGEPGLPSVRIVSTDGTIIRTDEFGRYSVPCAALPKDIGSNFTLKVDTRTLPTGYRITTENPRVERLTAGKFAKINFGAALSNVVDIDLTAKAFKPGSVSPSDALDRAIDGLLERIEAKPSSLRLSYVLQGGEEIAGARARLRAVEDMVRKKWRGVGRYKLIIERTVKRSKVGE